MDNRIKYALAGLFVVLAAAFVFWPSAEPVVPIEPVTDISLEPQVPTSVDQITDAKGNIKMITGITCDQETGEFVIGLENPTDLTFMLRPLSFNERVNGEVSEQGLKLSLNGRTIQNLADYCGVDADYKLQPGEQVRCEFGFTPNDAKQDIVLRSEAGNNENLFNVKAVGFKERLQFVC